MGFGNDFLTADEMVRVKRIVEEPKGDGMKGRGQLLDEKFHYFACLKAERLPSFAALSRCQALAGLLHQRRSSKASRLSPVHTHFTLSPCRLAILLVHSLLLARVHPLIPRFTILLIEYELFRVLLPRTVGRHVKYPEQSYKRDVSTTIIGLRINSDTQSLTHYHYHMTEPTRAYTVANYHQLNPSSSLYFTMPNTVQSVEFDDVEGLVRNCDYPAMRQNPLQLIMFPNTNSETEEEEIKWHTIGFQETFQNTHSAFFRKVCLKDGTPVGFALWTLDRSRLPAYKRGKEKIVKPLEHSSWLPSSLDVHSWRAVSKMLRAERERILEGRNNIWRKCIPLRSSLFSHAQDSPRCRLPQHISGKAMVPYF